MDVRKLISLRIILFLLGKEREAPRRTLLLLYRSG